LTQIKIDGKTRQYIRSRLLKYKDYEREISEIRTSIMNPWKESDENIGGGRSSFTSFDVEDKVIKILSSEQIAFRSKFISVVDSVLSKCTDDAQQIIELKYFGKEPVSWVKIASTVEGYSEDACRKIERKVIDKIAEKMGM